MGLGSRSGSVDLEKGAVFELDQDDASDKDALITTGISLAGLLLVIDVPVLVCYGPWAALAAAIVFAIVVLFVTWCVLQSGHYRDELQGGDAAPTPPPLAAQETRPFDVFRDAPQLLMLPALIPVMLF
ncbi:unnamed protein product [Alopecurus aequalis]